MEASKRTEQRPLVTETDVNSISQESQNQASTIICRGNLPKAAVEDLKKWLFQHFHYPYPNDAEKERLMSQTGLTLTQVNNWFINARRRIWKPIVERRTKEQMSKQMHQFHTAPSSTSSSSTPPSSSIPLPTQHPTDTQSKSSVPLPSLFPQQPLVQFPPSTAVMNPVIPVPIISNSSAVSEKREQEFQVVKTQRKGPDVLTVESLNPVETESYEEYMKNPETDKRRTKRSYEEAFVDENYNQMLDEYNRLRKENSGLKMELKKLSTNYQRLTNDMNKRHAMLLNKLEEMEAVQDRLEIVNRDLTKKLHERKKAKLTLPKPMALRATYEKKKDGREGVFKPITRTFTHIPSFQSLETPVVTLVNFSRQHIQHKDDTSPIEQSWTKNYVPQS